MKPKPKTMTEAAKLKALFLAHRNGLSQEAFGKEYKIGTQGMVWQYLNDKAPLNANVANKFAKGLGVNVEDFSPRLAAKLAAGEGSVDRIAVLIQLRTEYREHMQVLLAKRNKGRRTTKAYELYEEAIAEYLQRHKHEL